MRSHRVLLGLAVLSSALALPLSAGADDGPDDVRRTGTCSRSSEFRLRLRSDDDVIRVEFEIESNRRGARWAVILLHERRIVFRGNLRTDDGGSVELRRSVPNWFGADSFVVRATGPRSETCRVSAQL
ncbi:MAG TPA: hypothetical protein VLA69_04345 [Gaiellaceae bacterium]|nr:hypothetical protein [Gaiellaceae bacterium]